MNESYQIFKNNNNLEVRKTYKDKYGNLLDVSRIPAYAIGSNKEHLYDNARNIMYSIFDSDKFLTEESYPKIDRDDIYEIMLSNLDENDSKRDQTYVLHIYAFVMSGFGYSKNAIADMLGVYMQAVSYMLNIVQKRLSIRDSQIMKLINRLPEYIQSYIYRIYNDNLIYAY